MLFFYFIGSPQTVFLVGMSDYHHGKIDRSLFPSKESHRLPHADDLMNIATKG
ncbi:hypothetical protein DSCO28_16350 [Desulfosarcina ovata subsp. sediminis]|uniref:Uncharacterized protein n=1 Tax=Desulfosarcina ovata subsp. sediminis TaxID=885957 RepID=A0A5K7ZN86_9BACT|nr:hypothetical protein DSCO28_16350 [Desulfosarcina ovata subsp. sediminis]